MGSILLPLVAFGVLAGVSVRRAAAAGGTITIDLHSRSLFINPLLASTDTDAAISAAIFPGLLGRTPSGSLTTDLAQTWSTSGGGRIITIRLRQGLSWQNGSPVTSYDAAYTYRLIAGRSFPTHTDDWTGIRVSTPNAGTVVVRLPRPNYLFAQNLTIGIVPRNFAGSRLPVGSGSFGLLRVTPGQIVLGPTPGAVTPAPFISRLDINTGSGSISSPGLACHIAFTPVAGSTMVPTTRLLGLLVNVRSVGALPVRRALISAVAGSQQSVLRLVTTPAPNWPSATAKPAVGHLPSPATILRHGGWRMRSGHWYKAGKVLSIVLAAAADASQTPFVGAVRAVWRQTGIVVSVRRLPFPSLIRAVLYPGASGAAIVDWDFGSPDYNPGVFWNHGAPLNYARLDDHAVDKLSAQISWSQSGSKRDALRSEIGSRIVSDGAGLGLAPETYACRISPDIRGYQAPTLVTDAGGLLLGLQNWYLDTKLTLRNPF